jgi:hypothetical protein
MLPQIQGQIDSKDLENQIVAKYNISNDLASLGVSILLLYPDYAKFIKPDQTQQQQNLPSQKPSQQPNQRPPSQQTQ